MSLTDQRRRELLHVRATSSAGVLGATRLPVVLGGNTRDAVEAAAKILEAAK